MLMQDIVEDYHEWLCSLMRTDLPEYSGYEAVLRHLDMREFTWIHPLDENRDMDALDLRRMYFEEKGISDELIFRSPRSCLEVLVALSRRVEINITGEPGNDHIERLFWIMLSNLGVMVRDNRYDPKIIDKKIDIWLSRSYDKSGKGGLFPLTKTDINVKNVDIWFQMNLFLTENPGV